MPRDSNGVYTLPAGNPVVSGEDITSAWANSTLTDIASAITGSLSRTGQGGMQSTLLFGDGTVSAPGIAWTQEPGTGFYRAGTNDMRVAVAGDGDVMRWFEDTVYIRNAADSAWAPLLYEGGAGTVPDGSASGDTLVWDNTGGVWDTQVANPGGVLPVGTATNDTLIWNGTAWVRQAANAGGVLPVGTATNDTLIWNGTAWVRQAANAGGVLPTGTASQTLVSNGTAWTATSLVNVDTASFAVAIGLGMTPAASTSLSVTGQAWVGNVGATAGVAIYENLGFVQVVGATRAAPTVGAVPMTLKGSTLTLSGETGTVSITSNGTTLLTIRADGYVTLPNIPEGAGPDTPPPGAPSKSLYRNATNNELSIVP